MALVQSQPMQRKIYYQTSTNNKSFLNMHYFLKASGIKNNRFMLALIDPDLAGIDPHDKNLSPIMKQKVFRECLANYWYFLREVVRIPDSGSTGGGVRYKLHRGNLALNFCMMLNLNIFLELPRQQGKTISALCRYLWIFNFGTTNSEMAFMNKKMDDSKLNLARMKEIRNALPSYLQMAEMITYDGKRVRASNTVESLSHPSNGNKIRAVASARNKAHAASLLRGRTLPLWYADEWAFTPFNDIIYTNTIPAWKTAAMNAKRNNAPYGILMTTTPGFLTEDAGRVAYEMKENATKFTELWYDMTYQQLKEYMDANQNSTFVYIRYTYQQLGRSEEWFAEICKDMQNKWPDIRREVLLEWSTGVSNSPFTTEELEIVEQLVRQPIRSMLFLGKYMFDVYEEVNLRYPPIVGVDVSGGYNRDSSAITCIDSRTTKVFACMNCNYINTFDLAKVIYELVTKYMNNAIVNVERNGGYGASVLGKLVNTDIKKNLYYEIKDKVIEERQEGTRVVKRKQKMKVYGLDSSKAVRELLMEILRERMEYHKDKFVSPIIHQELCGLEVKKTGKIDHSANTHDDQIFSMLMALYVWYYGKDLAERYGIRKTAIKTDQDLDEELMGFTEKYGDVIEEIEEFSEDEESVRSQAMRDFRNAKQAMGKTYGEFLQQQTQEDEDAMKQLLSTKLGQQAYSQTFHIPLEQVQIQNGNVEIPTQVFMDFYND